MKDLACFVLGLVVAFGAVPISYAQSSAKLTITPRIEKGYQIFEISGTGFPASAPVRIGAVNRRTDGGVTMTTTTTETGDFSGVYVGKDADGSYYVVAPGTWRVRAKSGDTIAKTTFEAPRRPREGQYAGPEAALRVMANEAEITLPCDEGRTLGPIIVDAAGAFSVAALLHEVRGPVQGEDRPARVDGTVKGNVITFTVFVLSGDGNVVDTLGPFEVFYGREPRFERCV